MADLTAAAQRIRDRLHKAGVDQFEIFLQTREGISLNVLKGKLETNDLKNSFGFGIRVFQNGRLGFSFGTEAESDSAIDKIVQQAVEVSAFAPEATQFRFPGPQPKVNFNQLFSEPLAKISRDEKVDLARRLEAAAYATDKRIKTVRYAGYDDEIESTHILNSEGLEVYQKRSLVTLCAYAVAENQQESQIGGESAQNSGIEYLNPDAIGREAAERALARLDSQALPNYRGPILLTPDVAGSLLGLLAEALRGDAIAQKKSWLVNELGNSVFSPALTIIDDPHFPYGAGSTIYDGEGVLALPQKVVVAGQVQGLFCDQFWAGRLGRSGGQARRSSALQPPHPGFSNLVLQAGEKSFSELMTQLGEGFVIDSLVGLHTAEVASGRFSVGVEGYKFIKGQKIIGIRSMAWGATLRELLNSVKEVGCDQRVYGKIAAPSIVLGEAEISGRSA